MTTLSGAGDVPEIVREVESTRDDLSPHLARALHADARRLEPGDSRRHIEDRTVRALDTLGWAASGILAAGAAFTVIRLLGWSQ